MSEREYEWHEFNPRKEDVLPPGKHKKLKLYADENIPYKIIEELRNEGLSVDSVIKRGNAGHPDENIYQQAKKLKKVILTMDKDFWNDSIHPLRNVVGIIFIDTPPNQPGKAIDSLATFYVLFAKYYPLDWWKSMKAKVYKNGFILKYCNWEGKISKDEFKLTENHRLLTRKTR